MFRTKEIQIHYEIFLTNFFIWLQFNKHVRTFLIINYYHVKIHSIAPKHSTLSAQRVSKSHAELNVRSLSKEKVVTNSLFRHQKRVRYSDLQFTFNVSIQVNQCFE